MRPRNALGVALAIGAAVAALSAASVPADEGHHAHRPAAPLEDRPKAPVRVTMEELHEHGGVPPGWHLTVPPGDPVAGREVFAALECYKCHAVEGEGFPHAAKGPADAGPALTGMGSHHPPDYFLESILDPNAVIVTGPGHTGPDGLSVMPDYRDSLTVKQLLDLVAYMRSLTGDVGGHAPAGGGGHGHPQPPPGGGGQRHPHGG